MVLKPPRKSCAPSLHNPLPSGSSPTLSSSSTSFPAPPSANSKNSLSANNLQIGSGNPRPRPRCWSGTKGARQVRDSQLDRAVAPVGGFLESERPSHQSSIPVNLTENRRPASSLLGAITRIDTHVLSCEIAGPVTGHGFARVQIHEKLDVFGEQTIACGAFVENDRLSTPQHGDARHLDIHARDVKRNARTPSRRENTTP